MGGLVSPVIRSEELDDFPWAIRARSVEKDDKALKRFISNRSLLRESYDDKGYGNVDDMLLFEDQIGEKPLCQHCSRVSQDIRRSSTITEQVSTAKKKPHSSFFFTFSRMVRRKWRAGYHQVRRFRIGLQRFKRQTKRRTLRFVRRWKVHE